MIQKCHALKPVLRLIPELHGASNLLDMNESQEASAYWNCLRIGSILLQLVRFLTDKLSALKHSLTKILESRYFQSVESSLLISTLSFLPFYFVNNFK